VDFLTVWIRDDPGLKADLNFTKEKRTGRLELFFRLASKVAAHDRILSVYKSAKDAGLTFTAQDYKIFLRGFSKDPDLFNRVVKEVFQDMGADGAAPQEGHFKELLKAASVQGDIASVLETFRILESRYSRISTQPGS
jgi:hypothetical protein